jgi:hypothetical protein
MGRRDFPQRNVKGSTSSRLQEFWRERHARARFTFKRDRPGMRVDDSKSLFNKKTI